MSDPKNLPAKTIQVGLVKATIWRNTNDKATFFSTVLSRSYRDAEGNWHQTDSFRIDDLPVVEKVVALAFEAVVALEEELKAA